MGPFNVSDDLHCGGRVEDYTITGYRLRMTSIGSQGN